MMLIILCLKTKPKKASCRSVVYTQTQNMLDPDKPDMSLSLSSSPSRFFCPFGLLWGRAVCVTPVTSSVSSISFKFLPYSPLFCQGHPFISVHVSPPEISFQVIFPSDVWSSSSSSPLCVACSFQQFSFTHSSYSCQSHSASNYLPP